MARNSTESVSFRLTFQALKDPHGREPDVRLAQLLKFALRYCKLRCTDMAEMPAPDCKKGRKRVESAPH